MTRSRFLLIAVGLMTLAAAPAHADELPGTLLDAPAKAPAPHSRKLTPARGLQLASGLQASGPLNGSGPGLGGVVRLTEEEWRKIFPRKEPRP